MKKLGKLKLHNATLLNDREMKNIVGGYGDGYDEYESGSDKNVNILVEVKRKR